MYINRSPFIGYTEDKKYEKFSGTDSLSKFNESIKKMGTNWEYLNLDFDYVRNSYGHRSPEISEINLDNYILFTGCSFTEGLGLPVNKRYSDIVASMLNCDLYNLGLAGSGNDIIFYNLLTWLSTVKQKPKLIVLQWTIDNRFMIIEKNQNIEIYGIWSKVLEKFIVDGEAYDYFKSKTTYFKQLVRKLFDVPIIEIQCMINMSFAEDEPKHKILFTDKVDYARDLIHPGIKANQMLAEKVFNYIKNRELFTT